MASTRRNTAWRQRRQALQEAIPDSFWTALDRYDDGSWTAYTPGFAYEVAGRKGTQLEAFSEAERRIARTIRSMYEVGHRLPAASPSLETAQLEEVRNREAYEAVEERASGGNAGTAQAGPKVVERQWLRVHVDLSLADALEENPLVRRAVEPFVVTYGEAEDNGDEDEDEEDDFDDDDEPAADMAVDEDDTPWVEPPLIGSEADAYAEAATSARSAEIDSLQPFRAMLESRAQLVAQRLQEARAAGDNAPVDEDILTEAERLLARAYDNGFANLTAPRSRQDIRRIAMRAAPILGTSNRRVSLPPTRRPPLSFEYRPPATWKQGEGSLR